jgi:hypothetical protein
LTFLPRMTNDERNTGNQATQNHTSSSPSRRPVDGWSGARVDSSNCGTERNPSLSARCVYLERNFVSIHAPARGARLLGHQWLRVIKCFNRQAQIGVRNGSSSRLWGTQSSSSTALQRRVLGHFQLVVDFHKPTLHLPCCLFVSAKVNPTILCLIIEQSWGWGSW